MLIAILVLQIITLLMGVIPVGSFFLYLVYDCHRESKEKRARKEAQEVNEILRKNGILNPVNECDSKLNSSRGDNI